MNLSDGPEYFGKCDSAESVMGSFRRFCGRGLSNGYSVGYSGSIRWGLCINEELMPRCYGVYSEMVLGMCGCQRRLEPKRRLRFILSQYITRESFDNSRTFNVQATLASAESWHNLGDDSRGTLPAALDKLGLLFSSSVPLRCDQNGRTMAN